ncbi:MAG: carboxypeptidase regulatory-like domain-containing protein [Euryarchaeota archaeon]|nr:carboxypeptidase regulatory-like domain-containing protein [Euryarchaeota archaeon]
MRSRRSPAAVVGVLVVLLLLPSASGIWPTPRIEGAPALPSAAGVLSAFARGPPPEMTQGAPDLPPSLAGMNDVQPFYASSNAAIDQQAQELENAGVSWVRTEFVQSGGNVQWSTYDYWVLTSAPAHHLKILALLDYATIPDDITHADWALSGPGNFNSYITDYGNAATSISQHYGTALSAYEIYNEENSNYWIWKASNGSDGQIFPEQYGKMMTQAYLDIHAQNPSAVVMIGGLLPPGIDPTSSNPSDNQSVGAYLNLTYGSSTFAWYRANYGGADPVDAVGVHPYVDPTTQLPSLMDHVRYTIDQYQPGVPFWATEFGWTASSAGGYGSTGEVEQATNLTTAYDYFHARGDVTTALWFDWADFPGNPYGLGGMAANGSLTYWKSSWSAYYDLFHHDDATGVSINVPSTVYVGTSFPLNATVDNVGTSTWSEQGLWLGLPGAIRLGATSSNAFVFTSPRCGGYSISAINERLFTCGEVPPSGVAYYDAQVLAPSSAGTYTLGLQMVHDGVAWFGTPFSLSIVVQNATPPPPPRTYTLSGEVRNTTGGPLSGATVSVRGNTNATSLTSSTGAFSFNVVNGTYVVGAADPGWAYDSSNVGVLGSNASLLLNMTPLNGSLQVHVASTSGASLPGATVSVAGVGAWTTLPNGSIPQLLLPDGRYALGAFAPGYRAVHLNTTVSGGVVDRPTISLPSNGGGGAGSTWVVDFTLINSTGAPPVYDASVTMNGVLQGYTNAAGQLVSPTTWGNGTYPLLVSASGYATNRSQAVVAGTTYVMVRLNWTPPPPPLPGMLEGSYFPASATFLINQVAYSAAGTNPQGGAVLSVNLSAGIYSFRLVQGSTALTGSFAINSGSVTWRHWALGNSSSSTGWGSTNALWIELGGGAALGAVLALAAVLLIRRRRSPGRGETPPEGLSPPSGSGDHGLPDGDPKAAAGPGHPGP